MLKILQRAKTAGFEFGSQKCHNKGTSIVVHSPFMGLNIFMHDPEINVGNSWKWALVHQVRLQSP